MLITYYMVITSNSQREVRSEFLDRVEIKFSQKSKRFLVDFQTKNYRVFTKSYILSL